MAHFALVENGTVVDVLVVPDEHENDVDAYMASMGFSGNYVQTSYNTYHNEHPEGRPLRGNYAGIGMVYDEENDVFYRPQPFPSWVLDTGIWDWDAPVPYPVHEEGMFVWDEPSLSWVEAE